MNNDLQLILSKSGSLPTLSAVAMELLQQCQSDDMNFNDLAKVVSRDPALSIKILRMANSPIFGLRTEVRSISHAFGLLGLNCIRTLALSFSLVRNSTQEQKGALAAFWKRSVISSIAARELCSGLSQTLKEEAFLAGLLQDVGVMASAKVFGSRYELLYQKAGSSHDELRAAEVAEFGADHAEVGAWLLEQWGMPRRFVQLVRHSHDSRLLIGADAELYALARRVEYSGRMADLWSAESAQASMQLAEAEAAALFGEGEVDIPGLGARILASLSSVAPLFQLKLNDEEMAAVLEQANEVTALSVMRLQTAMVTLESEAMRDVLTGIYNRGSVDRYLRQRFNSPNLERVGLLFADIDHFKQINDTYGHAAGDSVLRSVAQRLSASSRAGDFLGRYGGEEFVIVVDLERPDDVLAVAERIRLAVERMPFPISLDKSLPVTISIGCVAALPERHTAYPQLMEDADQALYAAKKDGRNRSVRALFPSAVTTGSTPR